MRLKIGSVLALFAGIVAVTFVASSLVSYATLERLKVNGPLYGKIVQSKDLLADILPPPEYIVEPYLEVLMAADGRRTPDAATKRLAALQKVYEERHDYWKTSDLKPELRTMLTEGARVPAERFWEAVNTGFLPALRSGNQVDAYRALEDVAAAYEDHRAVIDELVVGSEALSATLEERARAQDASGLFWQTLSAVLALFILAGGMYFLVRHVVRPLASMSGAMSRLAAGELEIDVIGASRPDEIGDLARALEIFKKAEAEKRQMQAATIEAERRSKDEMEEASRKAAADARNALIESMGPAFGRLADGDLTARLDDSVGPDFVVIRDQFNTAVSSLEQAMGGVVVSIGQLRSGISEINGASNDLSRRTEQQAASLEETAAALDQITATVRKTSESADHASAVVTRAKGDAEQSGEVVKLAVSAMGEIESSSKQISQIIGVIDEIAFQTNLLALNAGVEAARAGDAGKGFAVVAQEVRALAQRSADAAKEIKALIQTSGGQVGEGVELVDRAGKALVRIVEQVGEINDIVRDISGSAREQATGIGEINTAVNQMDQVTQQNAAMVEEQTAAAQNLSNETEGLIRLVGTFRIAGAERPEQPERNARARAAQAGAGPRSGGAGSRASRPAPSTHGNAALKLEQAEDDWEEF